MAPRPYWKGYLKLSLVSCAVALYPAASKSERISFHWLNRETGNRLRQLMVDSETSEPVEREERVRGYQLAKNDYLTVEEEELDAVEIESSHTIEIESFAPMAEVDPVYLENSHYLAPDDKVAEEAFSVIREAMAEEGVVGIGRAVIARRERLLLLQPRGKGILATVLHYAREVRDDHAYFASIPEIKIAPEMLDLAKHIIRSKKGHFDLSEYEDRYESALSELIKAKQAGRPVELRRPAQPSNVVNLMDALRRSIAAEKPSPNADRNGSAEARKPMRAAAASRSEPKRTERSDNGDIQIKSPKGGATQSRSKPEEKPSATRRRSAKR